MPPDNLLIVADSERDANMLFAVGFFFPHPLIYLRLKGRCHIIINDLEITRARRLARHCRVLAFRRYVNQLEKSGVKSPGTAQVITRILRERRIKKIVVPPNFPFGLARELRDRKIKLRLKKGSFFPEREFKSSEEVKKISAALMMAEVGLAEGLQVLKSSKIGKGGRLMYHSVPLTAEKLRSVIDTAVLQAGGMAGHTIVASGRQSCDPHERGYGLLRANQPIVLDVFPRSQKTGYFGDITRTVVKGRASEAMRKLHHAVTQGQAIALELLRHGTPAVQVHEAVQRHFADLGYKTGQHKGQMRGFFHGTGHGVGLDLHESPRLGAGSRDTLQTGHVVTVEPGLYYPGIGGVRLEDVALVTANGPKNLTKFEKTLEL